MSGQTLSIANAQPMKFIFGYPDSATTLWIEDGVLHFEGNMDEAAKMFFEHYLKPMCDNYIKTSQQATLADDMAKATLARS